MHVWSTDQIQIGIDIQKNEDGSKYMADEISVGEMVGQKLPHDLEMIVTTFLPNLKYLETRFDRNDLNIKDLSIEVKDSNNRLGALEKRFDYFGVQMDKRFDLLTGELRDFKSDSNRRFDQMGNEFKDFKVDVKQRFDEMGNNFKEFKGEVKQRFDEVGNEFREFKGEVKQRFDEMGNEFKEFKGEVKQRFDEMGNEFKEFKVDVKQRFDKMGNEFKDFKGEVKQRFEQVDKRFENVDHRFDQIAASIERLGDKLDVRDARQRSFTMRMFGIAISMSFLGVLGVLIKTFGVL